MKNIISLILFSSLFLITDLKGQSFIAIETGFSLSNFRNTNVSTGNKLALTAGLGYEYCINKKIGVQATISFVPKGPNLGVVGNVTQFSYRLNYWEARFLGKYRIGTNPGFNFFLIGGPNVSRIASANERFFRIASLTTQEIPRGTGGISTTDAGINLGAEFNLPTDYGYISFKTYYQYGVGNLLQIIDTSVVSSRMIHFGLSFKIRTKKEDPENPFF